MQYPVTTTVTVADLVKLLDDIVATKQIAADLCQALEGLLAGPFAYVSDLTVFNEAHMVLEAARKAGIYER